MHCMTSDLWQTGAKNSVTNVNSLTQLYPILHINSIICYHSNRYNLETSVILSLGKCALIVTRPHLFHSSPIGRTFIRSFFFFFIGSFYIIWNFFWITAYKTSNNVLQISCCEFEYFSINKRYTSRRRQRNERTKSQNEPARIWGAVIHGNIDIHNRVRTPEKCSPRIYLPFSKQSIGATACGSTSIVWQLL